MDGVAVAEVLAQDAGLGQAPVLMLSTTDYPSDAIRGGRLRVAGYVSKPVKPSELADAICAALSRPSPVPEETTAPAAPPPPSRPLRILVAEDNLANQRVALRLLQKQGHTAVVVGNGRDAVAALEQSLFDLVLMDLQMPEMDGFEATAAIRRRECSTGQHIPIVALTAHALKGDCKCCLDRGMDGYLAKPLRPSALREVVVRLLATLATSVQGQSS